MFTIKTEALNKCDDSSFQCEEGKNIFAPIEVTNHHCSIQWERTEFRNYSQWNYLPKHVLDKKPFYLVKRNSTTITLKVLKIQLHSIQLLMFCIIRSNCLCFASFSVHACLSLSNFFFFVISWFQFGCK